MTYDVCLTIAGGTAADSPVYSTAVLLQLDDVTYSTLTQLTTCTISPKDPAPAGGQPWVISIAGNLLNAVATGALDLPAIKPAVLKFLELVGLVIPGKVGISTTPTPAPTP